MISSLNESAKPLSQREEYADLPLDFDGKAPRGPNKVEKFIFRDVDFLDHVKSWKPPYSEQLRELALQYWLGSEFDIAIVRRQTNAKSSIGKTSVIHMFDDRVDMMVNIVTGATWDPWNCWHISNNKTNYMQLISFLLTYYNAVVFDDTISRVSRIYFMRPLANPVPDILTICPGAGEKHVYNKSDYWSAYLEDFYTPSALRRGPNKGKTRSLFSEWSSISA